MAEIAVEDDAIRVGDRFSVAFQRTLRVPSDGSSYPLPPGLGRLPLVEVEQLGENAPASIRERGGVIVPLYQREALWLAFGGEEWKPNAVQVGVGAVNAISAEPWSAELAGDPQNYLVTPHQPWLDGINAGAGFVRQFVALPLGSEATVEAQLSDAEQVGGVQLRVYEPKPGRFPDRPPARDPTPAEGRAHGSTRLGLGAGGKLQQKIYPDPYGLDTWDRASAQSLFVHLVNGDQYRGLTGRNPPPTPVSAALYTERGLPWFELYEEQAKDLPSPQALAGVEPLPDDDAPLEIEPGQLRRIDRGEEKRRG